MPGKTIAERVAAGAAFLDEHDPDWWREDADQAVDLGALNLAHGDRCILGQRCPAEVLARYTAGDAGEADPDDRYFAYASHLRDLALDGDETDWTSAHGFALPAFENGWPELTAAWIALIAGRRESAVSQP
jgi:hypothetical protein